jgi:arylformamidase
VWPGNPPPHVIPTSRIAQGGSSNVSEIRLGSHTGTHVDPPFHFLEQGATADQLSLDVLVGRAQVLDLGTVERSIGAAELATAKLEQGAERVLLRTRNSMRWRDHVSAFPTDYVSLAPDGARWLVERGVRLVGIDFLSVEAYGASGHPTHHVLLEAGVIIVEGLDLSSVEAGVYTLVCLPLKVLGADGGPARAILLRD